MKRSMLILSTVTIAAALGQSLANAAPVALADAIYCGGGIVTVKDRQPQAEAIAIAGGRIGCLFPGR
jgi:hypothetical protein